ncbi:hypothetical protein ACHAWF_015575 [Thalassiosira exigua]
MGDNMMDPEMYSTPNQTSLLSHHSPKLDSTMTGARNGFGSRRQKKITTLPSSSTIVALVTCAASTNFPSLLVAAQFSAPDCDVPPFSPGTTYSAGDRIIREGEIYECKPPPDEIWCSFPGYEPGYGIHAHVAWSVAGRCAEHEDGTGTYYSVVEGSAGSDNFFCGRTWDDASGDCDAAQPCPTGSDGECAFPGEKCFGGTACDASKGDGKYHEYLGLAREDPRNELFCGSICAAENWCKDGTCPDGTSCLGGSGCHIQELVRAQLKNEQGGHGSDAHETGFVTEEGKEEEEKESDHFFCGLDWNIVEGDCIAAQHCPTGTDDECEIDGAVCFGGTSCDARKGHGELFHLLGLPYHDTRNGLFCKSPCLRFIFSWIFSDQFTKGTPTWAERESFCRQENWCRDGVCPEGMSCFGGVGCNIQDLVRAELKQENGGAVGGQAALKEPLNIDDPRRRNFCGMNWDDASNKCGDWCPEPEGERNKSSRIAVITSHDYTSMAYPYFCVGSTEVECPGGQSCFADTNCYFEQDIVPSASPTTFPPTLTPTVTYNREQNLKFCGSGWADAVKCTVERHCPNGDQDCNQPSESCYSYVPGCNIVDLVREQGPTPPPSIPPSLRPTDYPTSSPTNPPVNWIVGWVDVDEGKGQPFHTTQPTREPSTRPSTPSSYPESIDNEGEDWSEVIGQELYFCGLTQFDATQNCIRNVSSCHAATCPGHLMCFAVSAPCDGGVGVVTEKDQAWETVVPTSSPASSHSYPTVAQTFFCGQDPNDASSCHNRCPTGSPKECPGVEMCFGYISCVGKEAKPLPTLNPPQQMRQHFCAADRKSLETSCASAPTCNTGDPPCPAHQHCFGNHLCSSSGADLATRQPTPALPKVPTSMPTMTEAVTIQQPTQPKSETPELYCASNMQELKSSCAFAKRCSEDPCPRGTYCFPFTCDYSAKPESTIPDTRVFYCVVNFSEFEERCGLLEECPNGICPKGQSCLPFDCQQSLDKCPLNFRGYHSSQQCKKYYECHNGVVVGDTKSCGQSLKFDKLRGICVSEEHVDEHCYGITEMEEGQHAAMTGVSPMDICRRGFVGWHSDTNCREYHFCRIDGSVGPSHVCKEGTKFDKVRNECFDEAYVNSFCYGPAITAETQMPGQSTPAGVISVSPDRNGTGAGDAGVLLAQNSSSPGEVGNSSHETESGRGSFTSESEPLETLPLEVSQLATSSPSTVPSIGQDGNFDVPNTLKNTSESPPWFLQHTIFDPNGGGKTIQADVHNWLLPLTLIYWVMIS